MSAAALPSFQVLFGRPPEARGEAPGRVNLMGEHTDYNGGRVLPCAIARRTSVEVARRPDDVVEVVSGNVPGSPRASFRLGDERRAGGWLDYVQGVTATLRAEGLALPGMSLRVVGDVPLGSGLSSSASLLVAALRAVRELVAAALDDVALARMAHRAEHDFVGAPVGIMDQMACSLGGERSALLLDTRTLAFSRIPLPRDVELLVIDSGVTHRHASGGYRTRRAECELAARTLRVASLSDLAPEDLGRLDVLPEPLGRRVRHVVTENARVDAAAEALRRGDRQALGAIFAASHRSMRDDYEVSVPEVDAIVARAAAEPGCFGARLTGGGFGGAVVALTALGAAAQVGAAVALAVARDAAPGARVVVPGRDDELVCPDPEHT